MILILIQYKGLYHRVCDNSVSMRRSGGTQWLSATCSSSWHSQVEGVLNEEAVMDGDRCLRVAGAGGP